VIQIEVPDVGQGYVPYVAREASSGCLEASGAPDPPVRPSSWGVIKSLYQ
jgi:hypothetical protein